MFRAYEEQAAKFSENRIQLVEFFSNKIKTKDRGFEVVIDLIKIVAEADVRTRTRIKRLETDIDDITRTEAFLDSVKIIRQASIPLLTRINKEILAFFQKAQKHQKEQAIHTEAIHESGLGDKLIGHVNKIFGFIKDKFIDEFKSHVEEFRKVSKKLTDIIIPSSADRMNKFSRDVYVKNTRSMNSPLSFKKVKKWS